MTDADDIGLTADAEARIMEAAAAVAAAQPAPKRRGAPSRIDAICAAIRSGDDIPDLPVPASNAHARIKADVIRALAEQGEVTALAELTLRGQNTYARWLRAYRDACLERIATIRGGARDQMEDAA